MFQEVEKLQYLENTTLSSDLAQGFALKALTGRMFGSEYWKCIIIFLRQNLFRCDLLPEDCISLWDSENC